MEQVVLVARDTNKRDWCERDEGLGPNESQTRRHTTEQQRSLFVYRAPDTGSKGTGVMRSTRGEKDEGKKGTG